MFCLFNETCDIVTANISCVFIHFFYLDFILQLFWHSISIAVVLCLSFTIDQATDYHATATTCSRQNISKTW